jgi:ADP-specific Phosphofructokinase/Glucokinase conserved region
MTEPVREGMTGRWRDAYAELASSLPVRAPGSAPLLAGFSACVDQVYRLGAAELDAFAAVPGLGAEVLARIAGGRDGEIFVPGGEALAPKLDKVLGEPVARQLGGTGPQAAWSLAVLGAPSLVPLADRSAAQMSVLHRGIGILPAASAGTAKPPHYILEYAAGTRWSGGTVPRSSRLIVRLAEDGVERDPAFATTPVGAAGAGLVSGLNGIPPGDTASRAWVRDVVAGWRAQGLGTVHLELAEYVGDGTLPALLREYAGLATSVGLSLAELAGFGDPGDPAGTALGIGTRFGADRVVVHADGWSLAVHRADPESTVDALMTGNLLAAARARAGRPTADLAVAAQATFTDDLPAAGPLRDGWRVDRVPAPYLARPAATIGLGDTFVAGLLLATCLATSVHNRNGEAQ